MSASTVRAARTHAEVQCWGAIKVPERKPQPPALRSPFGTRSHHDLVPASLKQPHVNSNFTCHVANRRGRANVTHALFDVSAQQRHRSKNRKQASALFVRHSASLRVFAAHARLFADACQLAVTRASPHARTDRTAQRRQGHLRCQSCTGVSTLALASDHLKGDFHVFFVQQQPSVEFIVEYLCGSHGSNANPGGGPFQHMPA